jgi:hypothetical protein
VAVCETEQGFHRGLSSFNGLRWLPVEGMVAAPGLPGASAFNTDRRALVMDVELEDRGEPAWAVTRSSRCDAARRRMTF